MNNVLKYAGLITASIAIGFFGQSGYNNISDFLARQGSGLSSTPNKPTGLEIIVNTSQFNVGETAEVRYQLADGAGEGNAGKAVLPPFPTGVWGTTDSFYHSRLEITQPDGTPLQAISSQFFVGPKAWKPGYETPPHSSSSVNGSGHIVKFPVLQKGLYDLDIRFTADPDEMGNEKPIADTHIQVEAKYR